MKIGSVQLKIMRVLWDEEEATARRIGELMSTESPIAHSTVQTLLRQLEAKGAVVHEKKERTFVFRAKVKESEVSRSAAQDLLDRVFRGSVSGLVAHLLDNEEVSDDEMLLLKRVIEEKSKGGVK
jgi:BlaI family penicillinase repressor